MPKWRIGIRVLLVALWATLFGSQLVLYTSFTEIIAYTLLGITLFFIFLRFIPSIKSAYKKMGVALIFSFILGLIPYRLKLEGLALFLFEGAKDKNVTYYIDPYMNLSQLMWDLIFPSAHLILMYVISKTFQKSV